MSEAGARELDEELARGVGRTLASAVTELERGWYFAWQKGRQRRLSGARCEQGDRKHLRVRVGIPVERDLRMCDRGMDAEKHDLVILAVCDLDETLARRFPRRLTQDELRARLASLPAIFPDIGLYFQFEAVEVARSTGCCVVEVLPRGR